MSQIFSADHFDFLLKIVVIGDSGVGKTNILSRFTTNDFTHQSKPTIGVEFATKSLIVDGIKIKSQIWDTAGQQRFRAITHAYYKGASGALLVFDISRRSSYENLEKWMKQLKQHSQQSLITILVGNKCDLSDKRTVHPEEIAEFSQKHRLFYLETSALASINIDKAFQTVIRQIVGKFDKKQSKNQRPKPLLIKNKISSSESRTVQNEKKCCKG